MRGALQQNKKMAKASVTTYQFSIPAVATCPGAGACKSFCFAALEQNMYPSARNYRERMFAWTQSANFVQEMITEVRRVQSLRANKGKKIAVRIHASGDFYSPAYALKWGQVAEMIPEVTFYAYTKSVAFFKRGALAKALPSNFIVIFSLGGLQDALVNVATDRHSRIFATEAAALDAGYTLANEDDAQAWGSASGRIGLVMFGARARAGNEALGNAPAPRAPRPRRAS